MRIAIFGVGGAGGYFGARLAQAGEDVVFIARGEHLRIIREQGLRLESIKGDVLIQPAQATDDPASVGVVDMVLLGVKAWQVAEAAQAMRPMIGPETLVVPLENGVEAPGQLVAALGTAHVLGGLAVIISFLAGPGHIRHAGTEPFIAFGELDNRPSERAERLRAVFLKAGVNAAIPPDIHVALWEKFVFIVAISGVGAITRAPAGAIRALPETRQMLEQVMRETLLVGQARGIALTEQAITKAFAGVDGVVESGTASMQRDIMAGRPSELEYQNGAVVRLGQEVGVATPVNALIYHSLLPQELRARGNLQFSL
ncbi:MAG TPA: 2-dehydropantoate 2-reductase [Ktedonobacterales bacterium]|jgi:2-dehydropantoate 2-reductase